MLVHVFDKAVHGFAYFLMLLADGPCFHQLLALPLEKIGDAHQLAFIGPEVFAWIHLFQCLMLDHLDDYTLAGRCAALVSNFSDGYQNIRFRKVSGSTARRN